jgi:hypothetical protein
MNARESHPDTATNRQLRMPEWEAALFLVALLLVLAGFFIGVAQWFPLSADALVIAPTQAAPPATKPPAFEYFPDQYVNQATRVEQHIEAF